MKRVKLVLGIVGFVVLVLALAFPVGARPELAPTAQGGSCTIGTWTTVASLNTARSRTGVAFLAANGRFYVAGGEATGGNRNIPIEEYDPGTNTWTNRATLSTGVSNSGVAAVGNYIYVPGGWNGTVGIVDMQRFDPVANTVTLMAGMPTGNAAHAVTVIDNFIHVVGGSGTGVAGTTHYIYNTATDTWSTGAPLPTAVQYPAAVSDGTYVYVLGGNTTNLTTVQQYDPTSNTWATGTPMGTGRGGPGAFFDGQNVWAVNGGWASYLTSTEYWNGTSWVPGPNTNAGVRTVGAAFGNNMALKAFGWNGSYSAAAETLSIECAPPPAPSIVMTKTVGIDGGSCATTTSTSVGYGATVYYCYTVQNTGNVTLTHHTVTDDVMGTVLGPGAALDLAPGASYAFTETYVVMTDTITNNALWTAYISGTNTVATATASATVTGQPTDVSLTGFAGQANGSTMLLVLVAMTGVLLGAAFYIRRQWQS